MKSSKVKVYWERKGKEHGGASIPFDGVPFVHVGEKILWCHQGKDKRKKKQTKPDKVRMCTCHCQMFLFMTPFLIF